jgi:hypothetical protein
MTSGSRLLYSGLLFLPPPDRPRDAIQRTPAVESPAEQSPDADSDDDRVILKKSIASGVAAGNLDVEVCRL